MMKIRQQTELRRKEFYAIRVRLRFGRSFHSIRVFCEKKEISFIFSKCCCGIKQFLLVIRCEIEIVKLDYIFFSPFIVFSSLFALNKKSDIPGALEVRWLIDLMSAGLRAKTTYVAVRKQNK